MEGDYGQKCNVIFRTDQCIVPVIHAICRTLFNMSYLMRYVVPHVICDKISPLGEGWTVDFLSFWVWVSCVKTTRGVKRRD